jgi:heptosyltransferase-2
LAKPTPESRPTLLVAELWGLGDLALALPFLRAAASQAEVTLLAKPHAAPLLRRFAPAVALVPLDVPWTRFSGKYRLHRWPWGALGRTVADLRKRRFDLGVSARPDPRDQALLALAGVRRRLGYPRAGSGLLLHNRLPPPGHPHRAARWEGLASALGWTLEPPQDRRAGPVRRVALHAGAAQAVRRWPQERYDEIARRLAARGLAVDRLPETGTLDELLDRLAAADAFIGNDSGPGHLAALLGLPTFTIFGPQLPENFAPVHPRAAWIDGAPCPHKPCFDACRFAEPHCLLGVGADEAWRRIEAWLDSLS